MAVTHEDRIVRERKYIAARAQGACRQEAMLATGYTGRRATQLGYYYDRKPNVKKAISEAAKNALESAGVTRIQIVRELARVAMVDPRNLLDENGSMKALNKLDASTAAAVASVEIEELTEGHGADKHAVGTLSKVKFWNKVDALKELSRIAKLVEDAPIAPSIGPGLQVIVQQVAGTGVVQVAQRVEVNLPGPGLRVEGVQNGA